MTQPARMRRPADLRTIRAMLQSERELREAADVRYDQRFQAQKDAIQAALVAQEKAVNAALTAADRAVAKAETAAERRFDSVNEFRGQLDDQARTFVPRGEYAALLERVGKLEEAITRLAGASAGRAGAIGWVVAAAGLALTVAGLLAGRIFGQ